MATKTGAEIIIDCLEKEGVKKLFGYPGGSVLDIFDQFPNASFDFILTRHEQGAAHMADGYARSTGEVGCCIATSGPGATNLITGLATAYMDSVPVVAITGQVPTALIGNDAFQEADVVGITRPVTKHNYLVKDINELAFTIKAAFHIARTGRPGPVVIDIPKDVQQKKIEYNYPETIELRGYKPKIQGNPPMIKKAAQRIKKAKRPVLYVGGGAISSGAHKEVYELAIKTRIPVTMTLMGLGAFPMTHNLSLGMLGMHGTAYANYAIQESDLIIALGARFDDRITGKLAEFAPHADIIHVDVDACSVSKNVHVDIPIVGDLKNVLKEINKIVEVPETDEWLEKINNWKSEFPLTYEDREDVILPQYVIDKVCEITKGDAIISTEVGQHQMWAAQFYKFDKPRCFLTSGGLGTMGYGFPAAIGAKAAHPDKLVIDIAGDGSIQMNIQELATAVKYNIPVKIIILNNGYLGMVRQWQELFYEHRYEGTCLQRRENCPDDCYGPGPQCPIYVPDFVKLAEAYSAVGMRVAKKSEVVPALEEAFKSPRTVMMDIVVAKEENVFPMVPAGEAIHNMLQGMVLV